MSKKCCTFAAYFVITPFWDPRKVPLFGEAALAELVDALDLGSSSHE